MNTAVNTQDTYTYADYLLWPEGERWEIIDGHAYNMTPAPSRKHQLVVGNLHFLILSYFREKSCQVYLSPFDVRLSLEYSDDHLVENVVQPDLSVFCDLSKLDHKGAKGAPDLVVEVLSPSTAEKDMKTKLLLYQNFKVGEYWLVDPEKETMEIINLDSSGRYQPGRMFMVGEMAVSGIFGGLSVEVKSIFG